MATTSVSEREARQVAEAAREREWTLPSFGRELFLGRFRLDLIHPQPRLDAAATEQGERFLAFLLTEPDVGSDPARMGATAEPTEDGYVLNGTKLWATNGAIADVVVVMAVVPKSEGHRGGISAFILPYDTEGVTVEHRNAFMGLKGIENSVTRLENVRVPAGNLIGREGQGLKIALSTLN